MSCIRIELHQLPMQKQVQQLVNKTRGLDFSNPTDGYALGSASSESAAEKKSFPVAHAIGEVKLRAIGNDRPQAGISVPVNKGGAICQPVSGSRIKQEPRGVEGRYENNKSATNALSTNQSLIRQEKQG
jgi:hypothetical protein